MQMMCPSGLRGGLASLMGSTRVSSNLIVIALFYHVGQKIRVCPCVVSGWVG